MKRHLFIAVVAILTGLCATSCKGRTDKNVDTLNETVEVAVDTPNDTLPMIVTTAE